MKREADFYLKEFNHFYGRNFGEIREVFGGTVGYTYCIGEFFLKVYDKDLKMSGRCLDSLQSQLRILEYLQKSTVMRDRICYPIPTADGSLAAQTEEYLYAVFNRIPGEAIGWDREFTRAEEEQVVCLMTDLHSVDTREIEPLCPKENFDLSSLDELAQMFQEAPTSAPKRFGEIARQYRDLIEAKSEQARLLAEKLRKLPYVLCHTDVHGGNLMRSPEGKVFLIDWENMILAPKEADLFAYREQPFFPDFPEAASANREALLYYSIKRDLEDIWDFYRCILYEPTSVMSQDEMYPHTLRICKHLAES